MNGCGILEKSAQVCEPRAPLLQSGEVGRFVLSSPGCGKVLPALSPPHVHEIVSRTHAGCYDKQKNSVAAPWV